MQEKGAEVELLDQINPEEWQLREELAMSYRCAHKYDLNEGCDNWFSIALESQEAFLTLPYGILWSSV